ncbi:MAG: hypothetical protein JWP49_2172 [Phenylobacterium sp.]|nr:hypothetical protein [Phenylobacterium sp.]
MIVRRSLAALSAASLGLCLAGVAAGQGAPAKNWKPPAYKTYAQKLSDQTMAAHPELQSVTFHGVPPGMSKVYTMFAGSYPERIGNPDDPDDVDVIVKGITLIDPRWRRNDAVKRFVVQEPLRDKAGENIGLIVYAFKTANGSKGERVYTKQAMDLRDALQAKIPSYAALFEPTK